MSQEIIIYQKEITERIFTFRETQVMIDRDLAEIYGVETKVLNQAVKRNIERFPKMFRFQLSRQEKDELVTNCDRFKSLKHAMVNPYVFTDEKSHDRFVMIDHGEVYHFGASLKDLGKKWFAFSKMDQDALNIFERLGV